MKAPNPTNVGFISNAILQL